ncbi:hypothetical protein [Quadrisphaera sp. KR29]
MRPELSVRTVFEGFETDEHVPAPRLAGLLRRVRLLVWPPACSQPHH